MDSYKGETWWWVGLGMLTFVALRTWSQHLGEERNVSKPRPPSTAHRMLDQDTEDALKLETLCTLTEGSNCDLQAAATRIICERSVAGPAFGLLLRDVSSANPEIRAEGLVALRYLCKSSFHGKMIKYSTADAVITALERGLQEPGRSTSSHRPAPERHAMFILSWLLGQDVTLGLRAGVVNRWLAKYPFGRNEIETQEAIKKLRAFDAEDGPMSEIIFRLEKHPEGKRQMRRAGLIASSIADLRDDERHMAELDSSPLMESSLARRRAREDTSEQRMIRRRRREAVVVSDGAQPLRRDDIIQREDTVTDEDIVAEMQRIVESARTADETSQSQTASPTWRSWIPWQQSPT